MTAKRKRPKVVPMRIYDGQTAKSYVLDLCAQLKALGGEVADGDDSAWERMDPIAVLGHSRVTPFPSLKKGRMACENSLHGEAREKGLHTDCF